MVQSFSKLFLKLDKDHINKLVLVYLLVRRLITKVARTVRVCVSDTSAEHTCRKIVKSFYTNSSSIGALAVVYIIFQTNR